MSFPFDFPPVGYNKIAYYAFDATPVDQGFRSLTDFTDNANIVVVFEGTLWELADTVHYDTRWMRNRIYTAKKQILDDIRILQERGLSVLMNLDDAAAWSTETPFTTWDNKKLDYRGFAAFVDSCVTVVGFDGIALDVEHKAVDNMYYRNCIREFGKYFGPLSSDSLTKMYVAAVYDSRYGVPGEIFREEALSRYLNFVMDMGYTHDDAERFDFWSRTLGDEKVMLGMSHQDNTLEQAVEWVSGYPASETAGIMVYAGNVNKNYTDSIFAELGDPPVSTGTEPYGASGNRMHIRCHSGKTDFCFSLGSDAYVELQLLSITGKVYRNIAGRRYPAGEHRISLSHKNAENERIVPGCYCVMLAVNKRTANASLIVF